MLSGRNHHRANFAFWKPGALLRLTDRIGCGNCERHDEHHQPLHRMVGGPAASSSHGNDWCLADRIGFFASIDPVSLGPFRQSHRRGKVLALGSRSAPISPGCRSCRRTESPAPELAFSYAEEYRRRPRAAARATAGRRRD